MENETPDVEPTGIDRRSMLKRTAIVGGALVWTTPVVQSIAAPAFAANSPVVIVGCPPGGPFRVKFEADTDFAEADTGTGTDCGFGGSTAAPDSVSDDISVVVLETNEDDEATTLQVTLPDGFTLADGSVKSSTNNCGAGTITPTDDPQVLIVQITQTNNGNLVGISNFQLLIACVPS